MDDKRSRMQEERKQVREGEREKGSRKRFSSLGLMALIRGMRHEAEACGWHVGSMAHVCTISCLSHQAHLRCESTEKSMPLRGTKHRVIMRPCDHFRQSAPWCMCGAARTQVSRQQRCAASKIKMRGIKDEGQRLQRRKTGRYAKAVL